MTNRYKNRKNAVVNPPFKGEHCKTVTQRVKRHTLNALRREFNNGKTHANMKGGVVNAN